MLTHADLSRNLGMRWSSAIVHIYILGLSEIILNSKLDPIPIRVESQSNKLKSYAKALADLSEDAPGEGGRIGSLSAGNPLERDPLPVLVEGNLKLLEEPFSPDENGYASFWI